MHSPYMWCFLIIRFQRSITETAGLCMCGDGLEIGKTRELGLQRWNKITVVAEYGLINITDICNHRPKDQTSTLRSHLKPS